MKKILIVITSIHLLATGCGNDAQQKESTEKEVAATQTILNEQTAATTTHSDMPSEKCQFIFPSGIQAELKDRKLNTYFSVQTETACVMTLTDDANKAELFISAEKMASPEQAKRMAAVAQHMPGYIGTVDAGDGGHLSLTSEKTTTYYDLHFSIKDYRCTISSKIKTGTEESAGIYFNENKLKQLATDWSRQLKDILQ